MSDDLVKRLRTSWDADRSIISQTENWMRERREAADRIKELEAKLAKAVGLIQFLDKEYQHVWGVTAKSKVRTTLAELKGDDRG